MWSWDDRSGELNVLFTGKGGSAGDSLGSELPEGVRPAWLQQIHSAMVRPGRPGFCGEGDALITSERGVAVSVVTADCVPVLLASGNQVAAVHAGWRGLVQRILPATLSQFEEPADRIRAWIGPAIGPCCYEVGEEVADQVVEVSSEEISRPGPRGRPHLDLVAVAELQLAEAGVHRVQRVGLCTRCAASELWSYRRDGKGAGRNHAWIWRSGVGGD